MKIPKLFIPLLIGILAHTLTASARDLYTVNVTATCKTVNDAGRLVLKLINNGTILRAYAATQETAPDLRNLKIVYDVDADKIAIVGTNGVSVFDIYSFAFSTSVSNTAETQLQRLAFLYLPGIGDAAGSAIITETTLRNRGGVVIRKIFSGRLQYAQPATDQNAAQVCTGAFVTGRKLGIQSPPLPPP